MSELPLDRAGRRRSPATLPGFHVGHAPGNKGLRYPADPPKVEEIIAVMRTAGDGAHGRRLRGLIVIMWRRSAHPGSPRAQRRRSRSPTRLVAGSARQGRAPSRGRHGRLGLGTTSALARAATRASGRSAVVRPQRGDARTPLVPGRGARRVASHGRLSRGAASFRVNAATERRRYTLPWLLTAPRTPAHPLGGCVSAGGRRIAGLTTRGWSRTREQRSLSRARPDRAGSGPNGSSGPKAKIATTHRADGPGAGR